MNIPDEEQTRQAAADVVAVLAWMQEGNSPFDLPGADEMDTERAFGAFVCASTFYLFALTDAYGEDRLADIISRMGQLNVTLPWRPDDT